jgi:hypothetical protein
MLQNKFYTKFYQKHYSDGQISLETWPSFQIINFKKRKSVPLPVGYLGKYTAHNDYTEEEMRGISIAATILVSAATLEVGGAVASGRVTYVVAYNSEDHDAPNIIKEERERERREREKRGGERGSRDDNEEDGIPIPKKLLVTPWYL